MVDSKKKEEAVVESVVRNRDANGSQRPVRRTLRNLGPLASAQRPGYVRRWVNDTVHRVEDMKELGYSHVPDENGNPKYRMSRAGDDTFKMFLMETPQELYDQGCREKASVVGETREAMNTPDDRFGQYGEGLKETKN